MPRDVVIPKSAAGMKSAVAANSDLERSVGGEDLGVRVVLRRCGSRYPTPAGGLIHRSYSTSGFHAPGAIVNAPVEWTAIDANHVRGVYTTGDQSVTAILTFNALHDLVDFVSQDRSRASPDGASFTQQQWSTPMSAFRATGGYRLPVTGEARWSAPAPEGDFVYLEFHLDDIHYNVRSAR